MSLTSHLVRELDATVTRMGKALVTLQPEELERQRIELVRQAKAQVGGSPADLILQQVDAEIARRQQGSRRG